ncbi:hypothetical protein ES707_16879 [subsurface metagenome]
MNSNEVSARCGECGTELKQNDKWCPKCGSNKVIFHKSVGGNTLRPQGSLRARKKQKGFSKFVVEVVKGWFPSRNPKLTDGVHKERIVDRENNQYDEVVKDAKTGEITHKKHEPLSEHKKGG